MRKSFKGAFYSLLVLAVVTLLTACNGNGPGDGGEPDGQTPCDLNVPGCCDRNRECTHLSAAPYTAFCLDSPAGTCRFLCNVPADCELPNFEPTLCAGGVCVCDDGFCGPPACSQHSDCIAPDICVGGSCGPSPTPTGCVLNPSPLYTAETQTQQLFIYGTLAGSFVPTGAAWTYSSSDTAIADVDSATGLVTGGATGGTATLTATSGDASCTVSVINQAALGPNTVRVLVLDELTRAPIEGATVVVADATGTDVGNGTTAVDGSIELGGISAATVSVHVFTAVDTTSTVAPNGYTYVSAMGLTVKDTIVYLPRNVAPDKSAGFTGWCTVHPDSGQSCTADADCTDGTAQACGSAGTCENDGVCTDSVKARFAAISDDDVHVALAGASIPGSFIDLDLTVLIGESIPTRVKFGNVFDDVIGLPSGLVLGISNEFFKAEYQPLGIPGERTGWALGGNLPLAEITAVLGPLAGGGDIEIGPLLGALLPLFNTFNSAVKPGIMLTELPRVPGVDADGNAITLPDFASFPLEVLELTTPLDLKGIVSIPKMPQLASGDYLESAIVIAGVLVEGQGLVPLGLTAGIDVSDPAVDDANGIVNDTGDDPTPGKAVIRFAPQHGGVEGSKYVILVLSLSLTDLSVTGGGTIGNQARSGYAKLLDGLAFEEEITFGVTDFLAVPEGATYDAAIRLYTPVPIAGASFYRLATNATDDRAWIIYHGGTSAMTLIDPSNYTCGGGSCEDRAVAGANIDAQVVSTGGETLDDVFENNEGNLDGVVKILKGFATIDIQ